MTGASEASSSDNSDPSNDFESTYSSVLHDKQDAEPSTIAAGSQKSQPGAKPATKGTLNPDQTQPPSEQSPVPVKGDSIPNLTFASISRALSIQSSGKTSQTAPTTSISDRAAKPAKDTDSENGAAMTISVNTDLSSDYSALLLSNSSLAVPLAPGVDSAPATDSPSAKTSLSSSISVPVKAMQVRVVSPESTDPQFLSFGLTLKSTAPEAEKAAPTPADRQTPPLLKSVTTPVSTPTELPVGMGETGKGMAELKRASKPGALANPPNGSKAPSSPASAASANTNDEGSKELIVSRAGKVASGGDLSGEHGHPGYPANSSEVMPEQVKSEAKPANAHSFSPTTAALAAEPDALTVPATNPNQLVLRMQGDSGQNISVRVQDQGGQVQVAVRSSDPATASMLSQHLPLLQSNLQQAGWKSELFLPANPAVFTDSLPVASLSTAAQSDPQNQNGQNSGPDWSGFKDAPRKQSTIQQLWDEMLDRQTTTV